MTAKDFCTNWGIKASSELVYRNPFMEDFKEANHYKVTLVNRINSKPKQFTLYFSKGKGLAGRPTAHEVIDCLAMDIRGIQAEPDFEDWAASYGYDTDSRKAYKTFKAIERQAEKMARFLDSGNAWQQFINIEDE